MTDEQFNGLLDYLSQNKEKIFGSLMKEREEMNSGHNRKVAELNEAIRKTDEELARTDRLIRELDVAIEERDRRIRELERQLEDFA